MDHPQAAKIFNKDKPRVNWHDNTLWWVRTKRDNAAGMLGQWEELREFASRIKDHTLKNLAQYLSQFEKQAQSNGVNVHWALNAKECNEIVLKILRSKNATQVVKSKSMLTEECGLNDYLKNKGIDAVDTDLGELIVQLRDESPSHIVLPAIHVKKEEVGELFHQKLNTKAGNSDPKYLTASARQFLRLKFRNAQAAISGVNFAVADNGTIVLCTNEGNADLGIHSAPVHIACMGIEKIIPSTEHLPVFLKLLARSATGQSITSYTSFFKKPAKGKEMHIVLVDNGRSTQLQDPVFYSSLKCIRCGACMNTCPVYRRSGGHSYHFHIAGPIGSILAPNINKDKYSDLPFASTLCGSCTNVCPVKINIHEQLWEWRQRITKNKKTSLKSLLITLMSKILSDNRLIDRSGNVLRWCLLNISFLFKIKSFNLWVRAREMPDAPQFSFKEWYKKNRTK